MARRLDELVLGISSAGTDIATAIVLIAAITLDSLAPARGRTLSRPLLPPRRPR